MYKERIGYTDGARRCDAAYPNGRSARPMGSRLSDIPTAALPQMNARSLSDTGNRRSCDGTLRDDADSGRRSWGLVDHPLAMVYSPYQIWRDAYAPDVALKRGTLFSELDLPFDPAGMNKGGC